MFEKLYYINLDRRPDRRKYMEELIKSLKLESKVERVAAVDGKLLSSVKNLDRYLSKAATGNSKAIMGITLTPGAIGCAISHYRTWKKIIQQNVSIALILEDDVRIAPDFVRLLKKYETSFPPEFDIVYLGYSPATDKYRKNRYNQIFLRPSRVYGLFGYLVSNAGARKLVKIFPISYQIDTWISIKGKGLNRYLIDHGYRLVETDISEDKSSRFGTDIQKLKGGATEADDTGPTIRKTVELLILVLAFFVASHRF